MRTLVFDFETTGLTLHPRADLSKQPLAIEFGGIIIDDVGGIEEEVSMLINPGQPLDSTITKITGLTDEDLKDAPSFKQLLPTFRRLLACDQVIAHNLPFDMQVLLHELQRAKATDIEFPARRRCTVQEFADEFGRRMKLTELYEWVMGVPLAQTHRALDDVKALTEIVLKEGLWK